MTKRTTLWILLICLSVSVAFRVHTLADRSLWFDEAFSVRLIEFSWPEMISRAATDVHPPLYYVLLKVWGLVFGGSVFTLRFFSVVFSTLAVAAAYMFSSFAFRSRAIGTTAAFLLAVSSWQISYGWEARMYALGTFLSLLSSWLLLKSLRQPAKSGMWWILYGLTTLAFAYTHYFAFFTMAAQAIFVIGLLIFQARGRVGEILTNKHFWWAIVAAAIVVVGYLPWLPTLLAQNNQVQDSYWVPKLGGWSIPDTFYRMLKLQIPIPPHEFPILLLTLVPMITIIGIWIALPLISQKKSPQITSDAAWLTVLSGAVPIILAAATSFLGQSLYQDRFLVFTHSFVIIAVAAMLHSVQRPYLRTSAALALIIFFTIGHFNYVKKLNLKTNVGAHAATSAVYENREENEPVIVSSPFIFFSIDHYATQEHGGSQRPHLLSDSGEFAHFAGGPIITSRDILSQEELDKNPPRSLWMVDTTGFGGQEKDLGQAWQRVDRQVFPEVFPHQGDVIVSHYQAQ